MTDQTEQPEEKTKEAQSSPAEGKLPPGYRQGVISASTVLLGFGLAFAQFWAFDDAPWKWTDAFPAPFILLGIFFLLIAVRRSLDLADEEPENYRRTTQYLVRGVACEISAIILTLVVAWFEPPPKPVHCPCHPGQTRSSAAP
jgi:hypothetical protein